MMCEEVATGELICPGSLGTLLFIRKSELLPRAAPAPPHRPQVSPALAAGFGNSPTEGGSERAAVWWSAGVCDDMC